VVGEKGLVEELREVGLSCRSDSESTHAALPDEQLAELMGNTQARPDAVVVGLDSHFTYRKLATAAAYVQMGATFVGTNPDAGDRIGTGLAPGAGAMIAAVETVSGVKANIVGKPVPTMIQHLLREHGLRPQRAIMIGDRLDTDIAFGKSGGVRTCLVLTGVATQAQAEALPLGHPCRPDSVMDSLAKIAW
jgi:HAD superfamily hydrolase (TIGR01450 family)